VIINYTVSQKVADIIIARQHSTAMRSAIIMTVPCVCLSVTRWYCVKTGSSSNKRCL